MSKVRCESANKCAVAKDHPGFHCKEHEEEALCCNPCHCEDSSCNGSRCRPVNPDDPRDAELWAAIDAVTAAHNAVGGRLAVVAALMNERRKDFDNAEGHVRRGSDVT